MESKIQMPKDPSTGKQLVLSEYERSYYGIVMDNHRYINGFLTKGGDKTIHLMDHLPYNVNDGGCAFIYLVFSIETDKITSLRCNGQA